MKPSERSEAKGAQEGCAMTENRAGRLRPKAGKNHDRLWSVAEYPKGGRLAAYAMEVRNEIGRDAPRPGVCFFIPPSGRQPTLFPEPHTHFPHSHNQHPQRKAYTKLFLYMWHSGDHLKEKYYRDQFVNAPTIA